MSKPLLVILSPGFPADESDSTCLPLQQSLVLAINKHFPGIEINILAFQYPFTQHPYRWHNNLVIPLNGRNRGGLARKLTGIRAWKQLKQLCDGRKMIGILSFFLGECAIVGNLFARKRSFKHRVWLLGQDARAGNKYAGLLKKHPDQLVALSDFIADTFCKEYGVSPAHTVPPGIDPQVYPVPVIEKDIDIIGVGSLIPLKQFDVLVRVVKELVPSFPNLKAVICGDGSEKNKLVSLVATNKLQEHIEITGEKKHGEILAMMQRSKLLLHPSSYEGFGMVCLEALYAGAHVISFCQPQEAWIRHWHYAADEQQMINLSHELLGTDQPEQEPVMAYDIADTAKALIGLF